MHWHVGPDNFSGLSCWPFYPTLLLFWVFPGGLALNSLPADRDSALIPGSGRSPGEGNGNPLQYSCLENFMDRGAWKATVHGVTKESNMTQRLNSNNKLLFWDCVLMEKLFLKLDHALRGSVSPPVNTQQPLFFIFCQYLKQNYISFIKLI